MKLNVLSRTALAVVVFAVALTAPSAALANGITIQQAKNAITRALLHGGAFNNDDPVKVFFGDIGVVGTATRCNHFNPYTPSPRPRAKYRVYGVECANVKVYDPQMGGPLGPTQQICLYSAAAWLRGPRSHQIVAEVPGDSGCFPMGLNHCADLSLHLYAFHIDGPPYAITCQQAHTDARAWAAQCGTAGDTTCSVAGYTCQSLNDGSGEPFPVSCGTNTAAAIIGDPPNLNEVFSFYYHP